MSKFALTLFAVLVCNFANALPVGNPEDPQLLRCGILLNESNNFCFSKYGSLRFGFYGDYVFDRKMRVKITNRMLHLAKINTNAGLLALNFCNRVDVFATLGATNASLEVTNFGIETSLPPDEQTHNWFLSDFSNRFSWSVGVRAILWQCRCLTLGGELQYFRANPVLSSTRQEAENTLYPSDNFNFKYREWQGGLGLSYHINILDTASFVPYVAAKWAHCHAKGIFFNEPASSATGTNVFTKTNLKSNRHLGYAIGLTFVRGKFWDITFEGRFVDETAFHVNSQLRF